MESKDYIILPELQREIAKWHNNNFGEPDSYDMLLGVMEEVGELSHAQLKDKQKIRTNEDYFAKKKDAVGDITIFLMNYCTAEGIDFEKNLIEVWDKVKVRDWKKNPIDGSVKIEPKVIEIKWIGSDNWFRPVFKEINSKKYWGSTTTLVPNEKSSRVDKVIDYFIVHQDELEYFGNSFNCEPHGGRPDNIIFKIIK